MDSTANGFIDDLIGLMHYGKKGMKWGVRNDGEPHTRRSAKKEAKADAKWEKSIYSVQGAVKVHNAMAEYVNSRMGTVNDKYAGKNLDDPVVWKAHESEFTALTNAGYSKAVSSVHGSSPSGKKQAVMSEDGSQIEIRDTSVQHADFAANEPDLIILLKKDSRGLIVEMNQAEMGVSHSDIDEFLAHYGVPGMRWGHRKPAGSGPGPASEVQVKTTPGKKVKTSGGKDRPVHEDAIKAAVGKQIAKKSSTDALSNAELQAVITRMQLEAKYSQLSSRTKSPGRKFIEQMFLNKNMRDQQRDNFNDLEFQVKTNVVGRQVGRAITKTDLTNIA